MALILTFSQREKELSLLISPFGRDGREAPSEGKGVGGLVHAGVAKHLQP